MSVRHKIVTGLGALFALVIVIASLFVYTHYKAPEVVQRQIIVPFQVVQRNQGRTYALILVPVFINGHGPYSFLFDTGCPYCIVANNIATRTGIKSQATGDTAAAFGTSESVSRGITTSFSIGGASVPNVPVSVQNFSSYRDSMDNHFDGIVGYDYMRHFV